MADPFLPPFAGTCTRCGGSVVWFYEVHVCSTFTRPVETSDTPPDPVIVVSASGHLYEARQWPDPFPEGGA